MPSTGADHQSVGSARIEWYTVQTTPIANMEENNTTNGANQNQPVKPAARTGGVGSIIGAAIIILLLSAGAFYFWCARLNQRSDNPPPLILGNETSSPATQTAGAATP